MSFNIVIAGGSGNWANETYHASLLKLKKTYDIRVVAIIDPYDPRKEQNHKNLEKIVEIDNPLWIQPGTDTFKTLENYAIDLFIISTNPTCRQPYIDFALENEINIICDKPLLVRKDSAFKTQEANAILSDFENLEKRVQALQERKNDYIFCVPLRRRVLTPFVRTIEELKKEYERTGEGIRHFNFVLNSGICKYPLELATENGAHAYCHGVGTLSHSSYHYIDFMAWCISSVNANAARARVTLTNITRISDYLQQQQYHTIWNLNQNDEIKNIEIKNESILNAELDFSFNIKLYDKNNHVLSNLNYICNNSGFSNRTLEHGADYEDNYRDYSNRPEGGRMSDIYFDIQQGAIQSIRIIKNDVVLNDKHKIKLIIRKHPKLGGVSYEETDYEDAYTKNTLTPTDIIEKIISGNQNKQQPLKNIPQLDCQYLTNKLFATFYELIALEHSHKGDWVHKDILLS